MLQYVHEVEVDQLRLQVVRLITRGAKPFFAYLDVQERLLLFALNGKGYVKYYGTFISLDDYNSLDEDEQWDVRSDCIIDMLLDY